MKKSEKILIALGIIQAIISILQLILMKKSEKILIALGIIQAIISILQLILKVLWD